MPLLDTPSEIATSRSEQTPLKEISAKTMNQLAEMLNRKKMLRSEEIYERDWRGIARLAHVRNYIDDNVEMPMKQVITTWIKQNSETATVGKLQEFLGIIDRWDVLDDIQENLAKDTAFYIQRQEERATSVNALTIEDVECLQNGEPLPKYDACVLYAEKDRTLATNIIVNLESEQYGFKLFWRERDLLPFEPFELDQLSRLMETRCNHLIVVLTNEFLRSRENIFLVNYTQKLQFQYNRCKIIPIVYSKIKIPPTLDIYTNLKYGQQSKLFNFWERLASSLKVVD